MDKKNVFYIICIEFIIIGIFDFKINPNRGPFTAQILGLPSWMSILYLSLEHLLGFFAICSLILFLVYFTNVFIYLISLLVSIFTKESISFKSDVKIAIIISVCLAVIASFLYEAIVQKFNTSWQIPLDLLGILIFYLYSNHTVLPNSK